MLNSVHTYMHVCALGGAVLAFALLARQTPCRKPLLGNGPRTMPSTGALAAGSPGQPGGICVDLATRALSPGGLLVPATFGPDGTPSFSGQPTARHLARSEEHTSEPQALMRNSHAV